jgi:hypothetical protein
MVLAFDPKNTDWFNAKGKNETQNSKTGNAAYGSK